MNSGPQGGIHSLSHAGRVEGVGLGDQGREGKRADNARIGLAQT